MTQIQVTLLNHSGSDRGIANAAWTSSSSRTLQAKKTDAQVAALIEMLATERHEVPFEHSLFTFHCVLPIAIDRQLVKHRAGVSHSGASARYKRMPTQYLDLPQDVADIIKKSSVADMICKYDEVCTEANNAYSFMVDQLKQDMQTGKIDRIHKRKPRAMLGVSLFPGFEYIF